MDCTKCGLPIEGGRWGPDAVVLEYADGFPRPAKVVYHVDCVLDPVSLIGHQFQKWTVAMIERIQAAASQQAHNHNDLVDALEELNQVPALPTSRSCSAVNDNAAIGTPNPNDGAKV